MATCNIDINIKNVHITDVLQLYFKNVFLKENIYDKISKNA